MAGQMVSPVAFHMPNIAWHLSFGTNANSQSKGSPHAAANANSPTQLDSLQEEEEKNHLNFFNFGTTRAVLMPFEIKNLLKPIFSLFMT